MKQSWGGFGSLGGTFLTNRPAALQYNSEMDVYATDANSTVYKDTWNGTSWGGFTQL